MKNRTLKGMILTFLLMMILSGCSTPNIENDETVPVSVPEEYAETDSGEESAIEEYEIKLASGDFSVEDYKVLAELYAQESMIKKQRDLLEQCYRLYGDEQCLELLRGITVNAAEESSTVKEEAQRMLINLSTPGYLDEAVGMLLSNDWITVMMPKLREGSRRYYMAEADGRLSLCFEAGYDKAGKEYSTVWYMEEDGKLQCIMKSEDSIQMLTTQIADGTYQGAFESWLCMADSGDIYHETGTFESGVYTGDYTAQVKYGKEATDLFSLWSNRKDMAMTDYTGFFADGGITTAAQPEDRQKNVTGGGNGEEKFIVYAYTADKSGYLFMNVEEETDIASFVFDHSVFGMDAYPEIVLYEPRIETDMNDKQEQMINREDVKVRVYDSNIEWFDGSRWHVLGEVTEYVKEDPFVIQEEEQIQEEDGGTAEKSKSDVYKSRGAGIIEKKAPANTSSKASKPHKGKKPANPAAPVSPAAPETPKQPVTPPADNGGSTGSSGNTGGSSGSTGGSSGSGGSSSGSGGSSGGSGGNSGGSGGSSGGSGGNGGDSGGSSGGSGDSGGSGGSDSGSGGDVDIEWTDDIL